MKTKRPWADARDRPRPVQRLPAVGELDETLLVNRIGCSRKRGGQPSRSIDVSHALKIRALRGNEGQGNPGTESGLFPFAVDDRAPDFRIARDVVVWGENWPSKSPR